MNFFEALMIKVNDVLSTYLTTTIENISVSTATAVTTLSVISIVVLGLSMLYGRGNIKAIMTGFLTIAVVTLLANSASNFNTYIGKHLMELPDYFMSLSSGGGPTLATAPEILDSIATEGMKGFSIAWSKGGLTDPGPAGLAVVFLLALLLFGTAAAITLMISKIGLIIVLAVGPLAIIGLLFQGTRDLFTKWLTYALSFAMLAFFIGTVLGIASQIVTDFFEVVSDPSVGFSAANYFAPMSILMIMAYLFSQLPGMAASVTGGIAIHAGNFIHDTARSGTAGARAVFGMSGAPWRRTVGERMQARRDARMLTRRQRVLDRNTPNGGGSIRGR